MDRVYLDHNAGAPTRPPVVEAMVDVLGATGNPSSVHAEGRRARGLVETARERVAALVNARAADVVFTSGGTEANNVVLSAGTRRRGAETTALLVSAIEHASVLQGHDFAPGEVETLGVTGEGVLDLEGLAAALDRVEARGGRALVSLMLANNETGVLQPVAQAAALVRARGHIFHTDAVQAPGRVPIDIQALGADVLTLSAHKLGGPQGVGAIVLGREGAPELAPLLRGGGQERGRRAGTENTAAIVGFGVAAQLAAAEIQDVHRISALRASLEASLDTISPEVVVLGSSAPRLANTCLFALPGFAAETAVIAFDLRGVAVSAGAACSSGKVQASHVVRAMGHADLARSAIRVSLGTGSTEAHVGRFLGAWGQIYDTVATRRNRQAA